MYFADWRGGVFKGCYLKICEWLSIFHQIEVWRIKNRLHALKAKSLIEDIGENCYGVSLHDLYLEFVKFEVQRGALGKRCWVWFNKDVSYPTDLVMEPSGRCWQNLERVMVKYKDYPLDEDIQWRGSIEGIKWQHFSNVVVLHLRIGTNEVLDLQGLRALRSLELQWAGYNSYLYIGGEGKLIGLRELRNLGWLHLDNIHYAPCVEEIGRLTLLEVLWLRVSYGSNERGNCGKEPLSPPELDKCIHLRELVLQQCKCLKAFPDLSKLKSLRKVAFENCSAAKQVVGLTSHMCALQKLLLIVYLTLSHSWRG